MKKLNTRQETVEHYTKMMKDLETEIKQIKKDMKDMRNGTYPNPEGFMGSRLYSMKAERLRDINKTLDELAKYCAPVKPVNYINVPVKSRKKQEAKLKTYNNGKSNQMVDLDDYVVEDDGCSIMYRDFIYPIIFKATGIERIDRENLDKRCRELERKLEFCAGPRVVNVCYVRNGKPYHKHKKVYARSYPPESAGNYIVNLCVRTKNSGAGYEESLSKVYEMIKNDKKLPLDIRKRNKDSFRWPFSSFCEWDAVQTKLEDDYI